jgi:hypothetical protein
MHVAYITTIVFLSFVAIMSYILFQSERVKNLVLQGQMNPFKRKRFLSGAEKVLYTILSNDEDLSRYLIIPQLHLCTMLSVKDDTYDLIGKFDWLNRLYTDFFLFDKDKMEPILAIELNDSTHKWNGRKSRDEFVKKALEENGIPLVVIVTDELPNHEKVLQKIKAGIKLLSYVE